MSNINPETVFGNTYTDEDSQRLHFLKNSPPRVPEINGVPMTFPPYQFTPFPTCLYHTWTESRKRDELIQVARLHQLDLTKPLEREKAESLLPPWDSREVKNERERDDYLAKGWTAEPGDVKAAEQRWLDRVAEQAAMRAHDDLRLSEKARAEFDAADRAQGADHLIELPVPKVDKKRGRPRKQAPAAVA